MLGVLLDITVFVGRTSQCIEFSWGPTRIEYQDSACSQEKHAQILLVYQLLLQILAGGRRMILGV